MATAAAWRVVIPSATATNLVPCVFALLRLEPELSPERIIVVDDGARAAAEPLLPGVVFVSGQRPFVFARNANLGIRAACSDVVLLNDDAELETERGLSMLVAAGRSRPHLGVCSAAIRGTIGNPRQRPVTATTGPRLEPEVLAFVCVYLPWSVYERVGPLDERFDAYGGEDVDYCDRILAAGLELAIADACVVGHDGQLPSTFRTRQDFPQLDQRGRAIYRDKRAAAAASGIADPRKPGPEPAP